MSPEGSISLRPPRVLAQDEGGYGLPLRVPARPLGADLIQNAAERRFLSDAAGIAFIDGGSQRVQFFPAR